MTVHCSLSLWSVFYVLGDQTDGEKKNSISTHMIVHLIIQLFVWPINVEDCIESGYVGQVVVGDELSSRPQAVRRHIHLKIEEHEKHESNISVAIDELFAACKSYTVFNFYYW